MNYINTIAGTLKPSETMAVKARATQLAREGRRIIDLSCGEPDFDTPEHIKEAAVKALRDGKTKYTVVNGIPELREAVSAKMKRDSGLDYTAQQIIMTNGGKQALHEFFEMTIDPGDEVVIIAPYWVSYPPMVEIAGGKPVIVNTDPARGYKVSPDDIRRALTERTKCVVINSPSNPTGAGYSAAELKALGEAIASSKALILSDEVYEKITFDGFKFCSFAAANPGLYERTVTVNALSKSYSMTGWRVGYACGPGDIISAMGKYQSQTTSNINSVAQYAALAALTGPEDFLEKMLASFSRRLDLALDVLSRQDFLTVPVRPEGAFYLFVRFERWLPALRRHGIETSAQVVEKLLEMTGVAAVPGEAFGDKFALRISLAAADAQVEEGIGLLCKAAADLAAGH